MTGPGKVVEGAVPDVTHLLIELEGVEPMIVYTPLWETMRRKGITTYTLREKYRISGSTVQRLKRNESVSTNTLSDLCRLLDCRLEEIACYEPDGD